MSEDVPDDGYWYCHECGDSGTCRKGDERIALALHKMMMHKEEK
jgi:hypothetical protein